MVSTSAAAGGGFLFKAGLTNSNMDLNRDVASVLSDVFTDSFFSDFTCYNIGFGYRTGQWNNFKLQPELVYNVRGTRIDEFTQWKMAYLELPLNIQWGLDLIVMRPYIQVAPFVGYDFKNTISDTEAGNALGEYTKNANRFEYGLSLGGGIDLMNRIQLSLCYSWNFGDVVNLDSYRDDISGISRRNAHCLQFSMAYFF